MLSLPLPVGTGIPLPLINKRFCLTLLEDKPFVEGFLTFLIENSSEDPSTDAEWACARGRSVVLNLFEARGNRFEVVIRPGMIGRYVNLFYSVQIWYHSPTVSWLFDDPLDAGSLAVRPVRPVHQLFSPLSQFIDPRLLKIWESLTEFVEYSGHTGAIFS